MVMAPVDVFTGIVLSGPLLEAPYVLGARCVAWAAARDPAGPVTASGVTPFRLRLDDGREVVVQAVGARASLPARTSFAVDRPEKEDFWGMPLGATQRTRPKFVREAHVVAWIAPDERITVVGDLHDEGGPLRGRPVLVARELRGDGASLLTVAALAADEDVR
jgi:hypothetical protein